jgi:hypothetical protein
LIYNTTHAGIAAQTTDEVYGNIVSNCDKGVSLVEAPAGGEETSKVYNNTFARIRKRVVERYTTAPGTDVWNNIFYNSDDAPESGMKYCGYNLYYLTPSGCGAEVVADPQFVVSAPRSDHPDDFRLQVTSPALGAGRNGENIGAYAQGDEIIGVKR